MRCRRPPNIRIFGVLKLGVGVGVTRPVIHEENMSALDDLTVPASQIAKLLSLSIERVRQLVNTGYIPRIGKAKYPVSGSVQGYIRFLRDEEKQLSKSAADSGLKAARQREVELRIAREEGRLVEMEEVGAVVTTIFGTLRAELSGLPAAVTRDLKLREEIEKVLNGAFARSEVKFREASAAIQSGRDPLGTDSEDDA